MSSLDKRKANSNWIQDTGISKNRGALHRQLGIAPDKKIPLAKLKSVASGDSKLAKRARLAMTLRSFA